jgi:hypothetical protein
MYLRTTTVAGGNKIEVFLANTGMYGGAAGPFWFIIEKLTLTTVDAGVDIVETKALT